MRFVRLVERMVLIQVEITLLDILMAELIASPASILKKEIQEGQLVKHKVKKEVGLVLKKHRLHSNYYIVMSDGMFKEWHVVNISV